jgi:hypothetical protein
MYHTRQQIFHDPLLEEGVMKDLWQIMQPGAAAGAGEVSGAPAVVTQYVKYALTVCSTKPVMPLFVGSALCSSA